MQFYDYLDSVGVSFEDVDSDIFLEYTDYLLTTPTKKTGAPAKPKTVNHKLTSIKGFIDFLNCQSDYERKIFVEIQLLKIQEQYFLEDIPSYKEYQRALAKAEEANDKRARIEILGIYHTGARVSEFINIRPCDIKRDSLEIINGKGSKARTVLLSDDMIYEFRKYIDENNIKYNDPIIPFTRQTVNNDFRKYAGQCRIKLKKFSPHKLRHLFAIMLLENGATVEEVADLLGHTDINITRIYTRKSKDEMRRVVNKL